ncbi:MAG TPA: NB-ARC domain-containing protein [Thermoanaerobaculia bacterium]|nr:NB-ARC domain-containing protein [Thermoanaerobaculia bacterium]
MPRDYIFVSYSHQDAEWLDRLRIFLKAFPWGLSYKDGGCLWMDPYIQTGDRWRREIGDGLARSRIAVLLVSQDFLASDFIARHELPSILEAAASDELTIVCVPVSSSVVDLARKELLDYQWPRPPDQPLDLLGPAERMAALALIFRELYDLAEAAGLTAAAPATSVRERRPGEEVRPGASLPRPDAAPAKLFGVPAQRPHHILRLDVRDRIRMALLTGSRDAVGITGAGAEGPPGRVGLFGQGGLGKTVAAIDLVHDGSVRRAFPDGIYWLTLGQSPDLALLQSSFIQQVTGAPAVVESMASGSARIRDLLADRACLLVLDDVWDIEHARAFDVAGALCRTLTTTRDAGVLTALGAENVELDLLSEPQALALLANWIGRPAADLPEEAKALVRHCGYLPLAISVAGAIVRDGTPWSDLLTALEAGNLRFLEHPYASVFTSLRLSLDALPESVRERCLELAVAPEDVPLPVPVVARFWAHTGGLQGYECRRLLVDLERKALLYLEGEGATASVRFHDLQRDFLQLAADDVRALHAKLLDGYAQALAPATAESYRAWWTLPAYEPYIWHHLSDHLAKADRCGELRALLLDYRWIAAKLWATADVNALLRDFDTFAEDPSVNLVQGALRLSAHVLAKSYAPLAGQLTGRLIQEGNGEIRALLSQARAETTSPWLRPLTPSLAPPGGALVRTLEGHMRWANSVAVTPDGKWAVSASSDRILMVRDLATGAVLHILAGHARSVNDVAVTPDGKRAVSASADNTLKVWDLATGAVLHTLEGHAKSVNAVAVTPDGKWAVSASGDRTLKVWDLATGAVLHTLKGRARHAKPVTGVAVTPDGKRVVSTSRDNTLKIWDLATGAVLRTLEGPTDWVNGVAVTPDGKRAVSASRDNTLKVWDLATGAILHTLEGHARPVNGVAVTPDGKRAVSASDDRTLKVWDLATGAVLHTLAGHARSATGVAVTPDGNRAVSVSWNNTLKIWDLAAGAVLHALEGHAKPITGVAVTPDGKRAVSASWDKTLKVWDLATASVLHTLEGHASWVNGVTVTPDGKRAVSASADQTLRVWDLATGAVLHTLQGHARSVTGVAVTPDGKRAVSASDDNTLKIWDLATGAVLHALEGHAKPVTGVAVTPDGKRAVSASLDNTLKVWDLATGAVLHTLAGHADWVTGVAVTPDGKRAVSASDDSLTVWDLTTGARLHTHARPVTGVAVTPDGKRAVSVSRNNGLTVWELATGALVATFDMDGRARACTVAPDGVTIVAGDALGRVHFFRLENA